MKWKYPLLLRLIFLCAHITVAVYIAKKDGLKSPPISLVDQTRSCSKFCNCNLTDNSSVCVVPYVFLQFQSFEYWTVKNLTLFGYYDTPDILPFTPELQSNLCGVKHLTFEYLLNGVLPNNSFVCSTDMVSLNLCDNNVTGLSPRSFTGLVNLRFLNLSGNAIKEITPDIFRELYSILVIDVSRNELMFLPDGLFSELNSLERIDLSKNKLKKISEIDFIKLNSLHRLCLQNNDIHHLSTATVDWLISVDMVVQIEGNPLECTCTMAELLTLAQSNESRSSQFSEIECGGQNNFTGILYKEVDIDRLPCDPPEISYISDTQRVLIADQLQLTCQSSGDPAPSIYWITPWGEKFTHSSMLHLLPNNMHVLTSKKYSGIINPTVSNIHISSDGTLHIDVFRGFFIGNFTCVSYSYVGNSTAYVDVKVYSVFKDLYILSQCIGVAHAGIFLVIGLLTGFIRISIRFCKKRCCCCCCQKMEKKETGNFEEEVHKEEMYPEADSDSFGDDYSGTKPPYNSPLQRTPGSSPKKCLTPSSSLERETSLPANIWDTLEEARARLVDGVGRKVDKVRSHVKSITETSTLKIQHIKETGSLKIQSIKETGSNAAYRVRAGVVLGMEQVKFGVQSIKEFCGTGEMGTQTVSMVSFSTDVDTQEKCQIVKLHTITTV